MIYLIKEEYCSIPYVMQSIEILFISYSIGANDIKCMQSSKELYHKIIKKEKDLVYFFSITLNLFRKLTK